MSEHFDFQCRWGWCRQIYPSCAGLLEHVNQDHVQATKPCFLRDIPILLRAEEGNGESMSGMSTSIGSHTQNSAPNPPSSLPSPPAVTSPIRNARSPNRSLQSTPERPVKRRRVIPPENNIVLSPCRPRSSSGSPSLRDLNRTPPFATLASSGSVEPIQNPTFPDLNALIAGVSGRQPLSVPNAGSQSFSGSDCSVERQLTQSESDDLDANFELDDDSPEATQNVYAGELSWADEPTQNLPRSRSQTPSGSSQSQSQSQFSPRRASRLTESLLGAQQPSAGSPSSTSDRHTPSRVQNKVTSPVKTYLSGSLDVQSPSSLSHSFNGGIPNSRDVPSQPHHLDLASQSASQISSFVLQTQAPYKSQSVSQ